MDICIIGLGSIGQRHLKNIHAVAAKRGIQVTVDVVEPRELVGKRFAAPDEIGRYDMIFVTNPSQLHEETLAAARDKADFFKAEVRFLKSGRIIDLAEERNEYCIREIGYFFDFAMSGAKNIDSIPYANSIIGFVEG